MDHHTHLAGVEPEPLRRVGIIDPIDGLHLDEVVPGAEAADLPDPASASPVADPCRIRVGDHPAVLAPLEVPRFPVSLRDGVGGSSHQDLVQLALIREVPGAALAHPPHDPPVEFVTEPGDPVAEVAFLERGRKEPHAAGDVEADPARGDGPTGIHVRGGHAPDRETVTPVHVGHRVAGLHDPRKRGDAGHLGQGIFRVVQQVEGGEHDA
ncbi:MAG: hypothetical protein WD638_04200 [Nitriliruptoraceae bacterium]